MIASDGGIPMFGEDVPHPRNYGTFARVLGRYVRDRKTLSLEEAVRKLREEVEARTIRQVVAAPVVAEEDEAEKHAY